MAKAVKAVKRDLRKRVKEVLSSLPESSCAAQSSRAVGALLAMPEYRAAKRISVYLSMPSGEVATSSIVHDALSQGKQVFVPYTYAVSTPKDGQPKSIMDMVELHSIADLDGCKPDKWGIPTPSAESVAARENSFGGTGVTGGDVTAATKGLDLIVMPGMAFDADYGRLGHGMGYYDYFLARCHQTARMPFRVGLSLTEQFLPPGETVPMDSTDFRLDAVILGSGDLRRAIS